MGINLTPSQFVIDKVDYRDFVNGNFTDKNVLFKSNPKLQPWEDLTRGQTLDYVASASPSIYGKSSMLDSFTRNRMTKYVNTEIVRWSLKGVSNWKILALENLQPGLSTPGIGHSDIPMKFSHNLWVSSDVVYNEMAPGVEFIVNGNAVGDGTGHIYTLQLKTLNEYDYVDPALLTSGDTWCKRGANHSEASNEYGSSITHGGPSILTFQTQLGSYSKSHEITDDAYHVMLRMRAYDNNGMCMTNYPDQYVHFKEAEFHAQCKYEREQSLFWGRDSGYNLIDPTTGLHRKSAPGVLEFYEDGNLVEYDEENLAIEFLEDAFRSFFYNRVSPENADITIKCGLALLELVNKALNDRYARSPIQRNASYYTKPGSSIAGSKQQGIALSEPQILELTMFPYGSIKFEHMPILDDVELNGALKHPKTGKPLTSYWGFVDDIGLGANNNLMHLIKKGSEYTTHLCGTYSPAGAIDGTNNRGFVPTHSRRSYQVLYSIIEGMMMKDTKRSLFLHPSVDC